MKRKKSTNDGRPSSLTVYSASIIRAINWLTSSLAFSAELEKITPEVDKLYLPGEREALAGEDMRTFTLTPSRKFETDASEIHFRTAESQFHRYSALAHGHYTKAYYVWPHISTLLSASLPLSLCSNFTEYTGEVGVCKSIENGLSPWSFRAPWAHIIATRPLKSLYTLINLPPPPQSTSTHLCWHFSCAIINQSINQSSLSLSLSLCFPLQPLAHGFLARLHLQAKTSEHQRLCWFVLSPCSCNTIQQRSSLGLLLNFCFRTHTPHAHYYTSHYPTHPHYYYYYYTLLAQHLITLTHPHTTLTNTHTHTHTHAILHTHI